MQSCQVEPLHHLDPGLLEVVPVVFDDLVGLFAEGIGAWVPQYAKVNGLELSCRGLKVDEDRA